MLLVKAYNLLLRRLERTLDRRAAAAAAASAATAAPGVASWGGMFAVAADRRGAARPRVVVSMTTTPGRIGLLAPTLDSLEQQTWRPDRVVINVPLWCDPPQLARLYPPRVSAVLPPPCLHGGRGGCAASLRSRV